MSSRCGPCHRPPSCQQSSFPLGFQGSRGARGLPGVTGPTGPSGAPGLTLSGISIGFSDEVTIPASTAGTPLPIESGISLPLGDSATEIDVATNSIIFNEPGVYSLNLATAFTNPNDSDVTITLQAILSNPAAGIVVPQQIQANLDANAAPEKFTTLLGVQVNVAPLSLTGNLINALPIVMNTAQIQAIYQGPL